jgi:PST family polysaccharide transporter
MSRLSPTAWVTAEKLFSQGFGLVIFAVQAPLLGPHAFGLMAAVMVLVGFWDAVPGAAATDALISVRALDTAHLTAIVVATAAAGLAAGLCVWAAAGALAGAFGEPELVPIMRAMAVLPLLQALSIAPIASAQRDMRFRSLTIRTVVSQSAGAVAGLALALAGAGVWALVSQALVQRGLAVIILWAAVPLTIDRRLSWKHLRELSTFALPNLVSRCMSWSSGQLPRLILGVYLGPTRLGLFTLATRLHDVVTQVAIMPKAQVARVDLRRHAGTPDAMNAAVARALSQIGLIMFPLCIGGACVMAPLVDTWLDPRWHDAITPCRILLLMGVPFVTIYMSASLLLALNKQVWESVICTVQSVGTVAAVAAVARYGVADAALAMAALAVATVPLAVLVMRARCGIRLGAVITPQLPPLAAACAMGTAVLLLGSALQGRVGNAAALALEILAGAAVYTSLVATFTPHVTRSVSRFVSRLLALDA